MGNVHEERVRPELKPWLCLVPNPWLELWDPWFEEPTELNDPWPMHELAQTAPPDGGPSGGLGARKRRLAGWRPYSDALFGLGCQIFYVGNCKDSVACRATLADAGLADLLEQDDREGMVH